MCGVFGFIKSDDWGLHSNLNSLSHRGPDDFNAWEDDFIYVSHSRLSIVAVENGLQPFIDEKCVTLVNGEIYNFASLRSFLMSKGAKFQTNSDCEVVHHGYQILGEDIFEKLEGIFSIAIYDRCNRKLILARDPIGVKPLYYWSCGNKFAFSSEIKSFFLELETAVAEMNNEALTEFLFYRYVRSHRTMFNNVFKLNPGEIITFCEGEINRDMICRPENHYKPKNSIESQHRMVEILNKAVKSQLMGETKLGVYLSGGLDSSTICSLSAIYSTKQIFSYCVDFLENPTDSETTYADKIAKEFNTSHQNIKVSLKDVLQSFFKMAWHYDEPMGDAAVAPTYLVSQIASEQDMKVILAGEGADELLAGYEKYRKLYYLAESQVSYDYKELLNVWANSISVFNLHDLHYLGIQASEIEKISLSMRYDIPEVSVNGASLVNKLLQVDQKSMLCENYLMKADKMTAAHGIEERVPFLDLRFVDFCRNLDFEHLVEIAPRHYKEKAILKKGFSNILPLEIIERKKKGYGTPTNQWFKSELSDLLEERVKLSSILRGLNVDYILRLKDEHISGKNNRNVKLWSLLALDLWHYIYIENQGQINKVTWKDYAPYFSEKNQEILEIF